MAAKHGAGPAFHPGKNYSVPSFRLFDFDDLADCR